MTEHTFQKLTGREPEQDDMARVNCDKAGEPGHTMCGMCHEHELPRFVCGCRQVNNDTKEEGRWK